ncbi:MAG: hypothetical protein FJX30_03235 [Alphaproteobacteria bacterium]|nr:hypothetical protein [Alphaproteobacteria bacterium]
MKPIFNTLIRFLMLIIIGLIYNNYRNNQCIKTQKCQPIFVSSFFSSHKNYKIASYLYYKIIDNSFNINVSFDKEFNLDHQKNIELSQPEYNQNLIEIQKKYNDKNNESKLDFYNDNKIRVKKLIIQNTSKYSVTIKPKMIFDPPNLINQIKIYNCFCNSLIKLKPFQSENLFVYYSMKEGSGGSILFSFDEKN